MDGHIQAGGWQRFKRYGKAIGKGADNPSPFLLDGHNLDGNHCGLGASLGVVWIVLGAGLWEGPGGVARGLDGPWACVEGLRDKVFGRSWGQN